jgi:TRAP-type C4-dicarboxylate transport system permease small subunit
MPRAARGINVPREDLGLKVNRWLQRLDGWISYTWLLFPIAGLFVTWEVAMRYFFDSPHSWYEEISIFLLVFVSFLGSGKATYENQHISIDALYARLRGRGRRIANMIIFITTSIICVLLIVTLQIYATYTNVLGITYQSGLASPYSTLAYILSLGMLLNLIFAFRYAFGGPEIEVKVDELA